MAFGERCYYSGVVSEFVAVSTAFVFQLNLDNKGLEQQCQVFPVDNSPHSSKFPSWPLDTRESRRRHIFRRLKIQDFYRRWCELFITEVPRFSCSLPLPFLGTSKFTKQESPVPHSPWELRSPPHLCPLAFAQYRHVPHSSVSS